MRAGHICAAVLLPSAECTSVCPLESICLSKSLCLHSVSYLCLWLCITLYMCVYTLHVCTGVHVCVIEWVSREKQIHLSFSDKDARNKEEGEKRSCSKRGWGRKESQTDVLPITPNVSPCHLLPSRCSTCHLPVLCGGLALQSHEKSHAPHANVLLS